jgi:hypothetical protein
MMFEQERVIGRLQRRIQAEPTILACFLSGSYGRQADDDYSDIDVALVYVDDAARERGWTERKELVKSVMPYVPLKAFDGQHIRPFFYITLFSNGSKLDYRFESATSLQPNPWDGQIRILKDQNGWAEAYQAESARLRKPQPAISSSDLIAIDQRFWVMYWDALRLLARGDYDKPFPIYLEILSFTIPTLINVLPKGDPAREKLIMAYYSRDTQVTAKYFRDLLEAYLSVRQAIVQRYNLQPVQEKAFESELQRLIDKIT